MTTLTVLGFDNPATKLWLKFKAAKYGCQLRRGPYAWDLIKGTKVIRVGRKQFASVGHLAMQFDILFQTLIAKKAGNDTLLDFSRVQVHTYRSSGVAFELAQWPEPDTTIDSYFEWYEPGQNDLIFDLGAECGVSTYVLALNTGRVIAFEADSQMRVILQRNVARHGLTNVVVANKTAACFSELIEHYGQPKFCKLNLDELTPEFLRTRSEVWTSLPILFAARSKSVNIRRRFEAFLRDSGFETASNPGLGVVWGRPATVPHVS